MIKSDYWFIKPHTERKLEILEKYLNAWCDILFSYFKKNPQWTGWQTPYYIDCFAGRGMYHKEGKINSVKGSPIIAIEKLIQKKKSFNEKNNLNIEPKCRLIEYNKKNAQELKEFIMPYENELDIKVLSGDFNLLIEDVVKETAYGRANKNWWFRSKYF